MFISGFSCMMLWDSSKNLSLEMLSKSKNGYRNQSQRNKDMNESLPLLMQFGFPCVFNMLCFFALDVLIWLCYVPLSPSINESLFWSINSSLYNLQ